MQNLNLSYDIENSEQFLAEIIKRDPLRNLRTGKGAQTVETQVSDTTTGFMMTTFYANLICVVPVLDIDVSFNVPVPLVHMCSPSAGH